MIIIYALLIQLNWGIRSPIRKIILKIYIEKKFECFQESIVVGVEKNKM